MERQAEEAGAAAVDEVADAKDGLGVEVLLGTRRSERISVSSVIRRAIA